jgi:hypothetical protein
VHRLIGKKEQNRRPDVTALSAPPTASAPSAAGMSPAEVTMTVMRTVACAFARRVVVTGRHQHRHL